MKEMGWFLPAWPLALPEPFLYGAFLVIGLLGGEFTQRALGLPRITGYVLVGVLAGPECLGAIEGALGKEGRVVVDLALGFIVFELGHRLDFDWLRRNKWLLLSAIGEAAGCFIAIFCALVYLGHAPLLAAAAAAVGTATSPAVVMLVAHETRASGQITERMLLFTATNCVIAYLALTLLLPFLHLHHAGGWRSAILHPMYLLSGALLLGFFACQGLLWLAAWLGKREDRQFILLVAFVVLVVGLARATGVSVVAALLALGVFARNLDEEHALMPLRFGHAGQLLFVVLFVLTGASLEFSALPAAGVVAAAFLVVRFLGKAVALLAFSRLSGLRAGGAGLLSVALLPMSGLAIVMVRDTAALFPAFGAELAAVVLSAVAIMEILGPLATQFALRSAGETHPEAGAQG
jgi:NhaP-type Na+/H+ or K+/H+ antiporter